MGTTSTPSSSHPRNSGGGTSGGGTVRIVAATIVVIGVMVGVTMAIAGDLPNPVATHWGPNGTADGFSSSDSILGLVIIPMIVALVLLPLAWVAARLPSGVHWMAGLPVGTAAGIGVILIGSLLPQRGLASAVDAPFPGWLIPLGADVGIAATLAAARLAPAPAPQTTTAAAPAGAVRADLPDTDLVVWHGTTPHAPILTWMAGGMVVLGLGLALAISWWLLVIFAPLLVLLLASSQFDVTVGPTGVRASGILIGWPRINARLGSITSAESTSIKVMAYGGWGLRLKTNMAEMGVITSSGPGLRVNRADGMSLVISMADPDTPAGVLNTLLDRRASPPTRDDGSLLDRQASPGTHDDGSTSTGEHADGRQ